MDVSAAVTAAAEALPHTMTTVGDELPPGSLPFTALNGELLDELVARVGATLGGVEPRVAASTMHLGVVARLWGLALGAAVLADVVPTLAELTWTDVRGSVRLHLRRPAGARASDERLLATVQGLEGPFTAAVRERYRLAAGLLTGNVASGLAGTARTLGSPAASETAGRLLARAYPDALQADRRRRSCCLFYRVAPGAGVCGDCCFTVAPAPPSGTQKAPSV